MHAPPPIRLLISAVTLNFCPLSPAVEFISHRGESIDAPENTMAAFSLAWQRGSDAIELDVHLSADQKVVVCHDATLKRTTGVEGKIREMTLDEIQKLDAGRFKDQKFAGERIPELSTVLKNIPRGRCFIEIKSGEDVVPALVETIKSCNLPPERIVLISFFEKALQQAHKLLPEIKTYLIASTRKEPGTGEMKPSLDSLIDRAKKNGFTGLDLGYSAAVDLEAVKRVKREGLEIYVWTVNRSEAATDALKMGVDGITSDRAASLKAELLGDSSPP